MAERASIPVWPIPSLLATAASAQEGRAPTSSTPLTTTLSVSWAPLGDRWSLTQRLEVELGAPSTGTWTAYLSVPLDLSLPWRLTEQAYEEDNGGLTPCCAPFLDECRGSVPVLRRRPGRGPALLQNLLLRQATGARRLRFVLSLATWAPDGVQGGVRRLHLPYPVGWSSVLRDPQDPLPVVRVLLHGPGAIETDADLETDIGGYILVPRGTEAWVTLSLPSQDDEGAELVHPLAARLLGSSLASCLGADPRSYVDLCRLEVTGRLEDAATARGGREVPLGRLFLTILLDPDNVAGPLLQDAAARLWARPREEADQEWLVIAASDCRGIVLTGPSVPDDACQSNASSAMDPLDALAVFLQGAALPRPGPPYLLVPHCVRLGGLPSRGSEARVMGLLAAWFRAGLQSPCYMNPALAACGVPLTAAADLADLVGPMPTLPPVLRVPTPLAPDGLPAGFVLGAVAREGLTSWLLDARPSEHAGVTDIVGPWPQRGVVTVYLARRRECPREQRENPVLTLLQPGGASLVEVLLVPAETLDPASPSTVAQEWLDLYVRNPGRQGLRRAVEGLSGQLGLPAPPRPPTADPPPGPCLPVALDAAEEALQRALGAPGILTSFERLLPCYLEALRQGSLVAVMNRGLACRMLAAIRRGPLPPETWPDAVAIAERLAVGSLANKSRYDYDGAGTAQATEWAPVEPTPFWPPDAQEHPERAHLWFSERTGLYYLDGFPAGCYRTLRLWHTEDAGRDLAWPTAPSRPCDVLEGESSLAVEVLEALLGAWTPPALASPRSALETLSQSSWMRQPPNLWQWLWRRWAGY